MGLSFILKNPFIFYLFNVYGWVKGKYRFYINIQNILSYKLIETAKLRDRSQGIGMYFYRYTVDVCVWARSIEVKVVHYLLFMFSPPKIS